MALTAVLTWVGQRFTWPILVVFATWIKGVVDKDGDGKPDAGKPDIGKPDAPKPEVPQPAALRAQQVALAGFSLSSLWSALLPALVAVLQPLIEEALKALADRLGRQPTAAEAEAERERVLSRVARGRVRVSLLADDPLADGPADAAPPPGARDLES